MVYVIDFNNNFSVMFHSMEDLCSYLFEHELHIESCADMPSKTVRFNVYDGFYDFVGVFDFFYEGD